MRAAAALVLLAACGSSGPRDGQGGGAGAAAARAIAATVEAAKPLESAWRCALPPPAAATPATTAPTGWTRAGDKLTAAEPRTKLTIAAVAQARGAAVDVREALRAARVDLVIAVGGMGTTQAESSAALGALLDPAWLVVAIPGDAEDFPAHARAVSDLAGGGAAIVDGAAVRLIDAGAAVVATVPGERWTERLGAGPEGCVHDAADVARAVAALTLLADGRPRVLAGTAAPQGSSARPPSSDLAPGGLHAGEPSLAALVDEAGLDLVIHAPVGTAPAPPGMARRGTPAVVAAGSLDGLVQRDPEGRPLPAGVLLATVDARTITWKFMAH